MGKYRALYVDGLFKGMDYRVIETFIVIWFVVGVLVIGFGFLMKKGDSDVKLKDWLMLVFLFAIPVVTSVFFCKSTGSVAIIDTKTGKTVVVENSGFARKALDALETVDQQEELGKEKYVVGEVIKEFQNK